MKLITLVYSDINIYFLYLNANVIGILNGIGIYEGHIVWIELTKLTVVCETSILTTTAKCFRYLHRAHGVDSVHNYSNSF